MFFLHKKKKDKIKMTERTTESKKSDGTVKKQIQAYKQQHYSLSLYVYTLIHVDKNFCRHKHI